MEFLKLKNQARVIGGISHKRQLYLQTSFGWQEFYLHDRTLIAFNRPSIFINLLTHMKEPFVMLFENEKYFYAYHRINVTKYNKNMKSINSTLDFLLKYYAVYKYTH